MDYDLTDEQAEVDEDAFDEYVRENHPQFEEPTGAGYSNEF